MKREEKGEQKSFNDDRLAKRMEFDEIISEALDATRSEGGVPTKAEDDSLAHPVAMEASSSRSKVGKARGKHSWHLVGTAAVAFVLINLGVIGLFGADKSGVLSPEEADFQRKQQFGQEVVVLDAVDTFLQSDEYRGVHDSGFTRAVEDLNRALGIENDPDNEPFVADNFRFLDNEFIYRPSKEHRQ